MRGKKLVFGIILILLGSSCSKFRKIQKSEDWRVKYEAGLNYFNKKDYYHSALLFEEILPIVRGLPEGERVEFNLAYCQYYEKTYLLASNQFKTFFETYGRSPLAEEAHFMYAYSLFASTPAPNLDQREGIEAMDAMQNFLNQYPSSTFTDKAIEVIVLSQQKLEEKGFENARQYLKLRQYQAAVISFDNFRRNFPDSDYNEDAAFFKVEAQFKLADKSFPSLQLKRFQSVVEFYQEMVDAFPESKYLKEAQRYYAESLTRINQLKTKSTS